MSAIIVIGLVVVSVVAFAAQLYCYSIYKEGRNRELSAGTLPFAAGHGESPARH